MACMADLMMRKPVVDSPDQDRSIEWESSIVSCCAGGFSCLAEIVQIRGFALKTLVHECDDSVMCAIPSMRGNEHWACCFVGGMSLRVYGFGTGVGSGASSVSLSSLQIASTSKPDVFKDCRTSSTQTSGDSVEQFLLWRASTPADTLWQYLHTPVVSASALQLLCVPLRPSLPVLALSAWQACLPVTSKWSPWCTHAHPAPQHSPHSQ